MKINLRRSNISKGTLVSSFRKSYFGKKITGLLAGFLFLAGFTLSSSAQNITNVIVSPDPVCAGSAIKVTFDVTNGTTGFHFTDATSYQAYLSDAAGIVFTGTLGSSFIVTAFYSVTDNGPTTGLTQNIIIPVGTITGNNYKISIGSSNPTFNGSSGANASGGFTVNALPVVSAGAQVCIGSTITLSPTTGGTWASSDNTKATVTNAGVVTGVAAGAATFTFTNSTTGCSATTSSVTVNTIPTIITTTPSNRCGPGFVPLGATASAGTINWYSAPTGGGSLGTGTSFNTPSISSSTTYYVDATANGCTTGSRTAVLATINTIATITATSNSVVCAGSTLNLFGNITSGAVGTPTYSWTGPNGFSSSSQNPTIASVISNAAGIYTLTVTNGNGCAISQTTTVVVNPVPNVSITPTFTSGFVKKNTGSTVIYIYTITNIGLVNDSYLIKGIPIPDPNTVVMDITLQTSPGGVQLGTKFTPPGPPVFASFTTASIPPNATYTFQVALSVNGNPSKVYNHTQISATSTLCSSSSATAEIFTYEYNGQLPTASSAQLEISKTASVAAAIIGINFDYTITVVNNSSSTGATNVLISDQVPASLTIINNGGGNVSGNTISWPAVDLTKISGGQNTVQKTITVRASCSSVPSVTNTANVTSSPPDNGIGIPSVSVTTPVTDNIAPVAICKPATILIGSNGLATVTTSDVNNNSTDNCSIQSLSVSPSVFNCSNIGPNNVTLTVTDFSGNTATCTAVVTVAYGTGVKGTWLGTASPDWFNCRNWSGGVIPDISTDVTIPAGATNYPILNASTGIVRNITIALNASVIVNGAGILQIAGNIVTSGTFNVSAGTIEMIGSGQNIPAAAFQSNKILNLIISNTASTSVTLNGTLDLYGKLSFGASASGNTVVIGGYLTLKSTASSTAMVAAVINGNVFSGTVTVERYFPALRAWRLVTSPLSGTGNIFDSWQNGGGIYVPGKGMFVSGLNPTGSGGNGLDYSTQNNYSMKTWDAAGAKFLNIGNTKQQQLSSTSSTTASIGYFTFVRGDRNRTPDNTVIPNTNPTTLSSNGKLMTGTQTFPINVADGGFTLIGNPYASPVDFNKLTATNLTRRFYVWDPHLNLVGGYVVMEDLNVTGIYTGTPAFSGGNPNNFIQSSEAFFVQKSNLGTAASLSFNEPNKSDSNNLNMFRPMNPKNQVPSLRTSLYMLNNDRTTKIVDGNLAEFSDNFHAETDLQDALKFGNLNETLGLLNGTTSLAVNRRPLLTKQDTISYKFTRARQLKYQFEFIADNIEQENLAGFVEDKFLNKATPLNMSSTTTLDFEVTADAASAAADRFKIVFKPSIVYTSLIATVVNSDIAVDWKVPNELNIKEYDIERSVNGVSFTKVANRPSSGNSATAVGYNWLDVSPALGYYYYRIRSTSNNNITGYSNVVKVKINRSSPAMYVFPNPVTENTIYLQMNSMPKGMYAIRLINNLGQVIGTNRIGHVEGTATETIKPDNKLLTGIYQLEVTTPNKKTSMIKVIVK